MKLPIGSIRRCGCAKFWCEPDPWQETFLRAPRGASILALTARQVGKTTTAAWAIAHAMLFMPGLAIGDCLSGATPECRGGAAGARGLVKAGAELKSDNVYGLELENGSRVLALPGSDDSIRGLTVDGWIVADEAARLTDDLIAALRPMRARRPQARFAMLSTAWSRTDPFWTAWASDDPIVDPAESDGRHRPDVVSGGISGGGAAGAGRSMISTANISAFPAAAKPVRSPGTCTTARPRSTCRWCRPGAPSARHRDDEPLPLLIRSTIFSQSEYDNDFSSAQHATTIQSG